jgi:hypothetical protein
MAKKDANRNTRTDDIPGAAPLKRGFNTYSNVIAGTSSGISNKAGNGNILTHDSAEIPNSRSSRKQISASANYSSDVLPLQSQ